MFEMFEMFTALTWICLVFILISTYCSFGFFGGNEGGPILSLFGVVIVISLFGGFYSMSKDLPDLTVNLTLHLVSYWIIASLLTGVLYWVRKLFDIKKTYEEKIEYYEKKKYLPTKAKAKAILASMKTGYKEYVSNNIDNLTDVQLTEQIINLNYPPRFKYYRAEVLEASIWWPLTLIWLIGNRLITYVVEFFMNLFRGFFDGISRLTFRN